MHLRMVDEKIKVRALSTSSADMISWQMHSV